jgi:hypothetical protein
MKKKTETPDPHKLTAEEALKLLAPHKEDGKLRVHSLESGGFYMAGCDIDLDTVKEYFQKSKDIRLAGPNMYGMGHGLGFFHPKYKRYTFLETDKKKLDKFHKERGLVTPPKE